MSNTISILLSAKDEASSTIGKLTSNIATGVGNMAKQVQAGLTKASLALGAIGVGLTAYAKNSTDYTQKLVSDAKALQRQTGATIEESSKLLYVIQRMGGSADSAGSEFNILAKRIQEARSQSADTALTQETLRNKIEAVKLQVVDLTKEQQKNGDASGVLRNKIDGLKLTIQGYQKSLVDATSPLDQLGISTQNADKSNRSFNDILLDIADKFKKMPNGVEKTNTALALFGRSGTDMIKTLNLGRDGIIALEKKAEDLGLTLTDKTVVAISNYIASQKDLQDSTNGLKVQVGTLTAPVLTNFNNILISMASQALRTDSPLRTLVANVAAFGGPVATASAALLGFMANLFTINKGLGLALTAVLGLSTAITAGGGLLFAFGSVAGLDFGPFGKAARTAFSALIDWVNRSIKSLASLTSSPEWQGIKKVSQDALGFATNLLRTFAQALNDGTVTRVLTGLAQNFYNVATTVGSYLAPSLQSLWNVVLTQVLPVLVRLWKEVVEPLIPVVGTLLVGAIKLAVDTLTLLLQVVTPVINFLITNRQAVIDFAVAFGALAFAMKFDSIKTSFLGNMDAVIGKIGGVKGKVVDLFTKISGGTVMGNIAVAGALADIGLVVQAIQSVQNALTALDDAHATIARNAVEAAKTNNAMYTKYVHETDPAAKAREKAYLHKYHYPGFATGTSYAPGGMALVGEEGPEIVNLPRGSQVVTASQTQKMVGGGGVTINGGLHIHNNMDEQRFLKDVGWRLSLA
jgi:hypothetical protein